MKDQLKEIGVDMRIQVSDQPALIAAMKAVWHEVGFAARWRLPTPTPGSYPYFSSRGALHALTRYNNAELDGLLERGRTTLDSNDRR
jgi:ABC-type transport system substrate-binding protein